MKFKSIIFLLIIFSLLITPSFAATGADYLEAAEKLNALGLFSGTDKGFELDRTANRAEAAAMLVKLLGKESEAKEKNYQHPFKDVPSWANPFIGYLYENKLTSGIGADTFGTDMIIKAQEFTAFALRALGYGANDFIYAETMDFAESIGLYDTATRIKLESTEFRRGEMVHISFLTIYSKIKGSNQALLESFTTEITPAVSNEKASPVTEEDASSSVLDVQFDFNGKYYPSFYWYGDDAKDAEKNYLEWLEIRKNLPYGHSLPDEGVAVLRKIKGMTYFDLMNDNEEERRKRVERDEWIYELFTSMVTEKYPIITNGTIDQIRERQIDQIWYLSYLFYEQNPNLELSGKPVRDFMYWNRNEETLEERIGSFTENFPETRDYFENIVVGKIHGLPIYGNVMEYSISADDARNVDLWLGLCDDFTDIGNFVLSQLGIEAKNVVSIRGNHAWSMIRLADGTIGYYDFTNPHMTPYFNSREELAVKSHIYTLEGPVVDIRKTDVRMQTYIEENQIYGWLNGTSLATEELQRRRAMIFSKDY